MQDSNESKDADELEGKEEELELIKPLFWRDIGSIIHHKLLPKRGFSVRQGDE